MSRKLGRAILAVFEGRRRRLCGAPGEETEEEERGDLIGVVMEGNRGLNGRIEADREVSGEGVISGLRKEGDDRGIGADVRGPHVSGRKGKNKQTVTQASAGLLRFARAG